MAEDVLIIYNIYAFVVEIKISCFSLYSFLHSAEEWSFNLKTGMDNCGYTLYSTMFSFCEFWVMVNHHHIDSSRQSFHKSVSDYLNAY